MPTSMPAYPFKPTQPATPTVTLALTLARPTMAIATPTVMLTPKPICQGRDVAVPTEIVRGNPMRRQIALTFDAGASAEPLPKILAALRQAGVRSTFFLTGTWVKNNPDGLKAIIADGHEIANHSTTHPNFTQLSDEEIIKELMETEELVRKLAGRTTKPYFRPPFGARDKRVLAAAWSVGFCSIYWTIDSGDWREDATVDGVISKVLNNAVNGAIVVMHVGSAQTAEGLPRLIVELRRRGFEVVPLSDMLQGGL